MKIDCKGLLYGIFIVQPLPAKVIGVGGIEVTIEPPPPDAVRISI